jgi:predicted permease
MMIRSFKHLTEAPAGFNDAPMLSFRLNIVGDRYDPLAAKVQFVDAVEDALRRIPGVADAAAATALPIDDGGAPQRIAIEGRPASELDEIGASAVFVTSRFFPTLGLAPVEGRAFTSAESHNPETDVVIVSRGFAREFWPAVSAVDHRIGRRTARGLRWFRIVGVVPDVQFAEFGEETAQSRRTIYYPYSTVGTRGLSVMVRARDNPANIVGAVRSTLQRLDPGQAPFELRTMAQVRADTAFEQGALARMMGAFGGIALFLAAIGLYGVLAYHVRQRAGEIGVRMALGATAAAMSRMVLRQGARVALVGVALGALLSAGVARLIAGVLYQAGAADPGAYISPALVLASVVMLAVYLPARQAARIDPIRALRDE